MRPRETIEYEQDVITAFKRHKMLTMGELTAMLHCSVATVNRRLKEWGTLSSYNKNARYYTLPSISRFNKNGVWEHQGVFFSKHGTLKNTVIHLVRISSKGLSNLEMENILGVNPTSYLAQCEQLGGVRREKYKRHVVYFSSDEEVYQRQKKKRFPPKPTELKLPPDAVGIIILATLVKNPNSTPTELSDMLRRNGYEVGAQVIENLFEYHGLKKN